ncbi:MAG: hypothetical protein R3236_00340 [Phycisphaeraceae bacterium]|nr:hypothetical protein [Phycisphaeraceae bacterium]
MQARRTFLCGLALAAAPASRLLAKRAAPKPVESIRAGDVEYRASTNNWAGDSVEAWDVKHKELLWRRQIFVIKFDPNLERDIQDTFITQMKLDGQKMLISNERGSKYELDLKTLAVKVLKGQLVEQRG